MGKTIGVVGLGRIGREVATWCMNFGMHAVGYDPILTDSAALTAGVEPVSLDEVKAVFWKNFFAGVCMERGSSDWAYNFLFGRMSFGSFSFFCLLFFLSRWRSRVAAGDALSEMSPKSAGSSRCRWMTPVRFAVHVFVHLVCNRCSVKTIAPACHSSHSASC